MKLVMLAVTKMKENRICLAGINEAGQWVRPVKGYPLHLEREDLFGKNNKEVIFENFSIVDVPLTKKLDNSPHSEDYLMDIHKKPILISNLSINQRELYLLKHCENRFFKGTSGLPVKELLEKANRSLILVGPITLDKVAFDKEKTPRILFEIPGVYKSDRSLPCTDLKFIALGRETLNKNNSSHMDLNPDRIKELLKTNKFFLSLGLTREWQGDFHAMVIGFYTIPDYYTTIDYEVI